MHYQLILITLGVDTPLETLLEKYNDDNQEEHKYVCLYDGQKVFETLDEAVEYVQTQEREKFNVEMTYQEASEYSVYTNPRGKYTSFKEGGMFKNTLVLADGSKTYKAKIKDIMNLKSLAPYAFHIVLPDLFVEWYEKMDHEDVEEKFQEYLKTMPLEAEVTVIDFYY